VKGGSFFGCSVGDVGHTHASGGFSFLLLALIFLRRRASRK
jgi:MYXO-CTERM domain-containing protein